MSLPILRLFIFVFALMSALHCSLATDHIVGANRGWNPGINYTLWANNQTFIKGDLISFRYQKGTYNVYMVNETGYDNCTLDSAVGNWSSGKDFIELKYAKRYYFISGNGFCLQGMKVSVLVHDLPAAATPAGHHTTEKSGGKAIFQPRFGGGLMSFGSLAAYGVWIWFGSGLI